MKQINLGHWRMFFLAVVIILLLATIFSQSIVALAFLITAIGTYLGFELFVLFNLVFSISEFINNQIRLQQQMQQNAKKNPEETLKIVKPQ